MIYMEPHRLDWRETIVVSWMKKNLLPESDQKIILTMFDWFVRPCLVFIRRECKELSETTDSNLVFSLLNIFECLIENAELNIKSLQSLFLFSVFWSIGASVNEKGREQFNFFFRAILEGADSRYPPPEGFKLESKIPDGSIYDYLFDRSDGGRWRHWVEILPSDYVIPPKAKYDEIMVPTIDTARYSYLLKTLVNRSKSVLFVGPTGTGKSMYIKDSLVNVLPKDVYNPIFISFSAQTTANQTQNIIESKMDKRRKGIYGPPLGKKSIIFVDDLNMPAREQYGAQPPIELLRQWMDHNGWYNLQDNSLQEFVDIQFIGAMGPPGGGRSAITSRVTIIYMYRIYGLLNISYMKYSF
jgi:dynein heavy chain, axonemal